MAAKNSKSQKPKPGQVVCPDCGNDPYAKRGGLCLNTGRCWCCEFPRTPAYFEQMAADTAARAASFARVPVALAA